MPITQRVANKWQMLRGEVQPLIGVQLRLQSQVLGFEWSRSAASRFCAHDSRPMALSRERWAVGAFRRTQLL